MLRYRCPACDKPVESSDGLAGFSIRCPHCHGTIDVPRNAAPRVRVTRGQTGSAAADPEGPGARAMDPRTHHEITMLALFFMLGLILVGFVIIHGSFSGWAFALAGGMFGGALAYMTRPWTGAAAGGIVGGSTGLALVLHEMGQGHQETALLLGALVTATVGGAVLMIVAVGLRKRLLRKLGRG